LEKSKILSLDSKVKMAAGYNSCHLKRCFDLSSLLSHMYTLNDQQTEQEEVMEYAADTLLPRDLAEHLQERKLNRKQVIGTTGKLTGYLIGWSMNATGFFLAKALLLLGGSVNYWLAISLCFTCCAVVPLAGLADFRVNYKAGEGLEVDNAQSTIKVIFGLGSSAVTTYLSGQDYRFFQQVTQATIYEITEDIQVFEKQEPRSDAWAGAWGFAVLGAIALILLLGVFRK
jgi:hypothetical protein